MTYGKGVDVEVTWCWVQVWSCWAKGMEVGRIEVVGVEAEGDGEGSAAEAFGG